MTGFAGKYSRFNYQLNIFTYLLFHFFQQAKNRLSGQLLVLVALCMLSHKLVVLETWTNVDVIKQKWTIRKPKRDGNGADVVLIFGMD